MGESDGHAGRGTRCIAIVGPYLSGKTTLLESDPCTDGYDYAPGDDRRGKYGR